MPRYVKVTMPRDEAEGAAYALGLLLCDERQKQFPKAARLVKRLEAALKGKDLRITNKHNTPRPKGKRMGYLDVRRSA